MVKSDHMGIRIKSMRQARGWTQVQLAEAAGVTQQAVSKIERGETADPWTLDRIAEALGVHPALLKYGPEGAAQIDPETVALAHRLARLSPADQQHINRMIELMESARTR